MIRYSAFSGCSGLSSLTLSNYLLALSNNAFSGCYGLVGELIIQNWISAIGNHSFAFCTKLTELDIHDSIIFLMIMHS